MVLAGCSSANPANDAGGTTTITFSSWHFAEPGRGDALKKIVDEYNKSQTSVNVQPVSIPYANYASTILTQLGAGSGADVVNIENAPFASAVQQNLFADITQQTQEPQGGFVPVDKSATVQGKRYGVVYETNNYALIINQDLLDKTGMKAPTSYPEFVAVAKAMTDQSAGQYGFAFRNTLPQQSGWWADLSNFVYGNGGRWTTSAGEPTINSPEVLKAVQEYKQFYDNFVPQGADATTYRQMFWQGKVGMEIDNMAVPSIFMTGNPKLNLTVVPNPFPQPQNSAQLEYLSVNHSSKSQAADTDFINYLLKPDNQKKLSAAMSYQGVATPTDWGSNPPAGMPAWIPTYAKVSQSGILQEPQGAETQTAAIQTAVLTELDKVLRQNEDPATAMDNAQKAVVALLKK
jgi:multiple sugar transport system substrate-binding protein